MEDSCSVKQRQKEAFEQVINFNQPVDRSTDTGFGFASAASSGAAPISNGNGITSTSTSTSSTSTNFWKVLVYDGRGRDIVSPLLTVQELRARGVTLHLHLHSTRDPIASVPAVYFVAPTLPNIERIGRDLRDDLYGAYHLNFTRPVPRALLERLAQLAIESGRAHKVSKVSAFVQCD